MTTLNNVTTLASLSDLATVAAPAIAADKPKSKRDTRKAKQAAKAFTAKAKPAKKAGKAKAEIAEAPTKKPLSDVKNKLNKAFLEKLPAARPVFQSKFKPLNLAGHTPQGASERDEAFLFAIKRVYGDKPFTQADSGADSGNLARAINLGRIKQAGKIDGAQAFKLVA